MKKHRIVCLEKQVTTNAINHPVRLPEEVVEGRLKKAKKRQRKKVGN